MNVATYGPGSRFAMTDRGRGELRQSRHRLDIGPTALRWDGAALTIDIDEVSSLPLISRLRGRIVLTPAALTAVELPLTRDGAHVWRPFAPTARIEVALHGAQPWSGHGYFDSNFGTRMLEEDFSYWTWGRYPADGGSVTFYDGTRRDGTDLRSAVRFDPDGSARMIAAPPLQRMARSNWGIRRETRADPDTVPRQVRPMLDAPFYTRAVVETQVDGKTLTGVHEAVDLDRFASRWVKPMLAMRVPRRRGRPTPAERPNDAT